MKITDMEVLPLRYEYTADESWEGWYGPVGRWVSVLVRVRNERGETGLGEVTDGFGVPRLTTEALRHFRELVIGQEATDIEGICRHLYATSNFWGRRGLAVGAISGIEMALWDLEAKAQNLPLHQLLGGQVRNRIRAYASISGNTKKEALIDDIKRCLDRGFSAVKIRIGFNAELDRERAETIRMNGGAGLDLMLDAGQGYLRESWTVDQAIQMAKDLVPYDPFWLEEPYSTDDVEGYAAITASAEYPIAGGENAATRWEFKHMLEHHAVDIIQPDLGHAGGFIEAKHIARLAGEAGVQVAPHVWGSGVGIMAAIHFVMSTPECFIAEYPFVPNPLRKELIREPLKFEDGHFALPTLPGLGVSLGDETLERYGVRY